MLRLRGPEVAPFRRDIRPPDSWRRRSSPPALHRTLRVRRQNGTAPIATREMQMSPPLLPSVTFWLSGARTGSRFFLARTPAALGAMVPFAHRSRILFAPHIECRLGHIQNARADAFGVGRIIDAVDILIDRTLCHKTVSFC